MAKKRSAELDQEIRESLARISKQPGIKTPAQLDAEIDAILSAGSRADRHEIAAALGFRYAKTPKAKALTGTNLFALKEMVLAHGPVFPSRMPAVDAPHIKRCVDLGLAEAHGSTIQLTPVGRAKVAEAIREDLEREVRYLPRENTFVTAPEKRAEILARDRAQQQVKIERLERTLAKLR